MLNFGEPAEATMAAVVPFLERIFLTNASLEGEASPEAVRARCHQLAERRAPGLIAEYEAIGGSPLNAQSDAQAAALGAELARRGQPADVFVANQFSDPIIDDVLEHARLAGIEQLVALPVYPVCGPSTNVAALAQVRAALERMTWDLPVVEVTGWHRHPEYAPLRADGIRRTAAEADLDLADPSVRVIFSAHGTPVKYLVEGSRYDKYTEANCADVACAAGLSDYSLGYQNHGNRPIDWTQPATSAVVDETSAASVVVVPISFMHEQSETLAELDIELREHAEARGLRFYRVPVPHDDPRFAPILADLVQSALARGAGPITLRPCRCRATPDTFCTNG